MKHSALIEDIAKLEQKKDDAEKLTQRFQARAEKEEKKLLENERSLFDQDQMWQVMTNIIISGKPRLHAFYSRSVYLSDWVVCGSSFTRKTMPPLTVSLHTTPICSKNARRHVFLAATCECTHIIVQAPGDF